MRDCRSDNGGGGFLHILSEEFVPKKQDKKEEVQCDWVLTHTGGAHQPLIPWAKELNVGVDDLLAYRAMGKDGLLQVPMYQVSGMCGIQTRNKKGDKRFIKHSSMGLFTPYTIREHTQLVICEGFSDTVTVHHLLSNLPTTFHVIGRPSCGCGDAALEEVVWKWGSLKELVFIADNDDVGFDGALNCAMKLQHFVKSIKILQPPKEYKDIRAYADSGSLSSIKLMDAITNATNHLEQEIKDAV